MSAALSAASAPGTAPQAAFRSLRSDHTFFSAMSIAASCTIVIGFSRTYARALHASPPLPGFVHLHAAVFTSWLVLFVVQASLVARGRIALHRRLGVAGMALAATMLLLGVFTAIQAARLGYLGVPGQEFPDAASFLLVPLRDITVFSTLVAFGLWNRGNPPAHKRAMLTAVLGGLMPPAAARLPLVDRFLPAIGLILLLFLLAGPLYDFLHFRRVHHVYVWGGLMSILTIPPILAPIAMGHAWHAVAHFLMN